MSAEGDSRPPELTAAQYAMLAETQRKKRVLADTQVKYHALVEQNKQLLLDRQEAERQTYEVTEYMRREILVANEKIAKLEAAKQQDKLGYEEQIASLRARLDSETSAFQQKYEDMESDLQQQLCEAREHLASLNEFKQLKSDMENELLKMREETDNLTKKLEQTKQEDERIYVQGTAKLKKEFEQKLEEVKKRYEEDMDDRLDSSIKRILQQNRRTAQELQLHVAESKALQNENSILQDERKQLMQEIQIKLQMEQGYVTRNAKQARELKETTEKLLSLERTLQNLVEDFEKERDFMRKQWNKATDDMQREVMGYKRLIELKTKELKNVRRLAQEVLLQRSDVEIFFISSLKYVRKQIETELSKENSTETPSLETKKKVIDVSEMTWVQRERVLRVAFSKINNQARATQFLSLPEHHPEKEMPEITVDQGAADLMGLISNAGPTEIV